MSPFARPRPVSPLVRFARFVTRAFVLALRILIVGLSMGVAPPSLVVKVLRHEDPTVQVEEDEEKTP
jgi:hypothetical protein